MVSLIRVLPSAPGAFHTIRRRAGRVACDPQTLELFAGSLSADDQVAMEATSNALAIARILEGHVARVVLAHPRKVKRRTALKNEIGAALMRSIAPRSPASDPFGAKGRAWLAE